MDASIDYIVNLDDKETPTFVNQKNSRKLEEVIADRPVFLYIHGSSHNAHTWHQMAKAIGDDYAHIALDLSETTSFGGYLSGLSTTINQIPSQNIILVGHSMGSAIAQCYLLDNPSDKITGFISMSMPTIEELGIVSFLKSSLKSLNPSYIISSLTPFRYWSKRDANKLFFNLEDHSAPEKLYFLGKQPPRPVMEMFLHVRRLREKSRPNIPVLGLFGVNDRLYPITNNDDNYATRFEKRWISDSNQYFGNIKIFKGLGHDLMMSRDGTPVEVSQSINEWLILHNAKYNNFLDY